MKKFYITTPIYYPNDKPHIGTGYSTIMCDILKRYHKLLGRETYFVTGTDEHGDKVVQAAKDYKDWKHKTLAPGESPPPLDVAAEQESGFSFPWNKSAEKRAKKDYIAVLAQIEESKTEVAQKAQFVADVKGLDIAGNNVIPALNNLASGIRKIADTLDQAGERLESVCENANDAQLTDASWMKNALNLGAVTELGPEAAAFVQQALVETHLQPPAET